MWQIVYKSQLACLLQKKATANKSGAHQ